MSGTRQAGAGHAGGGAEQRAAAAKQSFRVISGFTPEQLQRLRSQIVAFKKMKRDEWDFAVPGRPGITAAQHMAERKRAFPGLGAAMGAGARRHKRLVPRARARAARGHRRPPGPPPRCQEQGDSR